MCGNNGASKTGGIKARMVTKKRQIWLKLMTVKKERRARKKRCKHATSVK